jgi:hypothetical protein
MSHIKDTVSFKVHVLSDAEYAALGDEGGIDDGHEEPEDVTNEDTVLRYLTNQVYIVRVRSC